MLGCGTYAGCSTCTTCEAGLLCKMRLSGGLARPRSFPSPASLNRPKEGEKHIPPDQGVDLLITEEGASAMFNALKRLKLVLRFFESWWKMVEMY